jgi:hypothetical protein
MSHGPDDRSHDENEENAKHVADKNDEIDVSDIVSSDLMALLPEDARPDAHIADIHARRKAVIDGREQIRLDIPDIVARAKALQKNYPPDFREVRSIGSAGSGMTAPLNTDLNIMDAFDCLFGQGNGRPYFDTFKGLNVAWTGETIDDDFDLKPLVEAMNIFRIPTPSFEKVEKLFKRFARQAKINSLTERMKIMVPKWDGLPRLDDYLLKLFASFDTELNRQFGRYFWLSLYNRAMHPGCNAPIVLALFGSGGIGKSYFGTLISREMTGSPSADSVPLDWNKDFNYFLREITGKSVIANVAEMAGFTRADLTKIKSLTTRTMDVMDEKFERSIKQLRQWVMIMDGNEYAGLQRDETGNRRFYPMFVGQLPFDARGQVQWRDDFYVDFSTFSDDFWQLMAEAQHWMEREGMIGYQKLVSDTEKKVKAFSEEEMRNDRGTIRDDDLEMYVVAALAIVEPMFSKELRATKNEHRGRVTNKHGAIVHFGDLRNAIITAAGRNIRVIPSHLKTKITALGAKVDTYASQRVFVFDRIESRAAWDDYMGQMFGDLYMHYRKRRAAMDDNNF